MILQQKFYEPEGNDIIYLKWWKGRIYTQVYPTLQDSGSDLKEKSKALQTKKS